MKRIYLFLLACLAVHLAGFALPNSSVLLQHKGNVTVYLLEEFQKALDDAVDGDTLFLSKGTYPGFTIDKKITVRGAGQATVAESITISMPDSLPLTATLLEGFNVSGKITVNLANGLKVKQCSCTGFVFNEQIADVLVDRCYCYGYFQFGKLLNSMIVKNSIIKTLYPIQITSNDVSFVNCNIDGVNMSVSGSSYAGNFRGSFINCILKGGSYMAYSTRTYHTFSHVTLINTLYYDYKMGQYSSLENCYKGTTIYTTVEELLENGYIGNDGTVVGSYGGSTPYTSTLSVPVVTASDVKLDAEQRKLNVNLTISAE